MADEQCQLSPGGNIPDAPCAVLVSGDDLLSVGAERGGRSRRPAHGECRHHAAGGESVDGYLPVGGSGDDLIAVGAELGVASLLAAKLIVGREIRVPRI